MELYIELGAKWMHELPVEDAPFEPGDRNWGWINGKPVAIDYALTETFLDDYYPNDSAVASDSHLQG